MSYQGVYINLDRSADRRAEMEAELARVGLTQRYKRHPAADGNEAKVNSPLKNAGEIGCFLSHAAALKANAGTDRHLHILEDDVVFATSTARTLDGLIADGALENFDILYTDIAMPLANDSYRDFKNLFDRAVTRDAAGKIARVAFQTLDVQSVSFHSASSYVVNKKSFAKIAALYDAEIAAGIRAPVDDFLHLQAKVGAIRSGCVFPFITSVRVEHTLDSTVRIKPDVTRKFTATNIGRYSFFIDCDWQTCQRLMDTYIPPPPADDRHAQLLSRLLAFSLTTSGS